MSGVCKESRPPLGFAGGAHCKQATAAGVAPTARVAAEWLHREVSLTSPSMVYSINSPFSILSSVKENYLAAYISLCVLCNTVQISSLGIRYCLHLPVKTTFPETKISRTILGLIIL